MTLVRGQVASTGAFIQSDLELNPDPKSLPELDPKDQFLLLDLNTSSTASGANASASAALQNVSWLRKTDHRERQGVSRVSTPQEQSVRILKPCVIAKQSAGPLYLKP